MVKTKKYKRWEISIIEFKNHTGKKFKVTRKIPELSIAETKIFRSKKKAIKKFEEWSQ